MSVVCSVVLIAIASAKVAIRIGKPGASLNTNFDVADLDMGENVALISSDHPEVMDDGDWRVIEDPEKAFDDQWDDRINIDRSRLTTKLRNFPLSSIQKSALSVLYQSQEYPLAPPLEWDEIETKRKASPVQLKTTEQKNGEVLPRIFTRLYESSADDRISPPSRKLMRIEDKPFPGIAVKYQGHHLNPPKYLVKVSDMSSDKEYMEKQIQELMGIKDRTTGHNREIVEDRLAHLQYQLRQWNQYRLQHD